MDSIKNDFDRTILHATIHQISNSCVGFLFAVLVIRLRVKRIRDNTSTCGQEIPLTPLGCHYLGAIFLCVQLMDQPFDLLVVFPSQRILGPLVQLIAELDAVKRIQTKH